MADLSSILGGMVQGFKDFGTGLVDMFGTGGAAIGDAIESIRTGRATSKNQDDFRKWLYQTDNTQDAAAKGLGTILNGVQTVSDFIPGAGAITRNPLFNGVQGAIGGVADEFKMAGKDYDLGRAAQRAGVGAASGLASAYTNQALGKTGNKLINNGLVRGAAGGALAGGIANAGYTGIEGGSVQDMINAGLYGAQTGALVGGTTGLARELIKPTHKMDVALTDDERRARIANIDDQLAKLDTSTQEGIDRHNELMMARIKYEQPQDYMMSHRPTKSGIYADDLLQEGVDGMSYPSDVYDKPQRYSFMYNDTPDVINETMAQLNAVRGNPNGEVTIYRATPGDTINDGDWITLSKSYADIHNNTYLDGKGNVLEQRVNVRDIQPAMDDLAEWGYFPQKKAPTNVADLMAESKPKTYYHGSPETDITEFDMGRAGKNTRSGEKAIYFTDDPATAEEFSYERTPTDSLFFDKKGRKGGVYEANLDMKNTLDLGNLSDAQIEELWQYASPLGKLDGKEGFIKDMKHLRQVGNDQLIKSKLDLSALANSPYDSFQAKMYPGENDIREYGIFDASKAKITKSPKTVADLMLSPEQKEYFKDSVVRDENGNLKPMYHGTRGDFTVFGDNAPQNTSNGHASVGHWFTPTEEGAQNFANSVWYGDGDPKVMKTYLNIKNPKIYETVDNSAAIEPLTKRLQELELNPSKLSDTELYHKNIYHASTVQNMINLADKDTAVDWLSREKGYEKQKAIKLVDEIANIKKLADEKKNLQNTISELRHSDAYQQFKTDIYKMDGQTADDANVGGVGMALRDKNSIKKYVDKLKSEGYDGIVIKGTMYDAEDMGGPNDQYVAFDSNQIKSVDNLKPTADADIMYSKIPEGQLGLFDQPMPKPEPEPVALPKSLGEQASLFDQPKQPIVEAQVVDTEPVNPYAPVDGQVTQAMRDRAADVLKNYAKKGVPDNELYNMVDESTLPAGYKEFREIVDSGKSYAKEKLGAESANKADLRRVVEYLYDDTAKQEEMLRNVKIEESNDAARRAMYGLAPRKSGSSFSEKMLRRAADEKLTKEFAEKIGKIENRVPELVNSLRRYNPSDLSVRKGLTAAADEVLSERLGIAPGNTIKYNGPADVRSAYGRYSKTAKNLALTKSNVADPEQAVSTMAHERLHAFQNEADLNRGKYGATNRYDKRVTDAFDDLRKDLEEAKVYKSYPETAERYGSKDAEYFYNTKEQEARMLQQYLNNKGYADLAELKRPNTGKSRSGEFGTEVNAAFDKFFDKLRALSKKGVALPALTALFGGGAIAGALSTGKDDKKKKSEVK